MNVGEKISELRKRKGITQSELGQALCISAQAISKWEHNLSEPDLSTISALAKYFEVSTNYFMDDDIEQNSNENENNINSNVDVIKTQSNDDKQLTICSVCYDAVGENEIAVSKPKIMCKKCYEKYLQEDQEIEQESKKAENSEFHLRASALKNRFIWSSAIAVSLSVLIAILGAKSVSNGIVIALVVGLLAFVFVFQVMGVGVVSELVSDSIGHTISMPGVIFSLDIGGILFFLCYKLIIAPLITLAIAIIFFVGGCLLAIVISPFTFVPNLINSIHTKEEA